MSPEEQEAASDALAHIIEVCESYRGLVPTAEEKAEESTEEAPPAVEVEIEAAPVESAPAEESAISVIDRGVPPPPQRAASTGGMSEMVQRKRGPGRPRKDSY